MEFTGSAAPYTFGECLGEIRNVDNSEWRTGEG
jgi:hypothetical protein